MEKVRKALFMFVDLFGLERFDYETLVRFTITVKKNYRQVKPNCLNVKKVQTNLTLKHDFRLLTTTGHMVSMWPIASTAF
jgi:hypothetical protein